MALGLNDVKKVAGLARLQLTEAEATELTGQLNRVLDYVDQLGRVDTTGVEPLVHAIEQGNRFRDDDVRPSMPRPEALRNAPKTDGRYFLVPQVLDAG